MNAAGANSEVASELWVTARKLAEMLPGEKTERAWLDQAKRENWDSRKVEPGGRGRGATEFLPPPHIQAQIRQRLLGNEFIRFRQSFAAGESHTTAKMMFLEEYNNHSGAVGHILGIDRISLEDFDAVPQPPAMTPPIQYHQAPSMAANPHEQRATEPPVYVAPDWDLLEALIRVAEYKLKGVVTTELAAQIDQVMVAWRPVADERPDLAARLDRIKAAADLLRPPRHQ
jgi:hypothetical protein